LLWKLIQNLWLDGALNSSFLNFFNLLKCAFYSLKAHCFGRELLVIFLVTRGQRLPGAARAHTSDGSGSKIFHLGRVGSAIYGLGLNLENFHLKMSNFFPLGQKKSLRVRSKSTRVEGGLASSLLWVKSKLGSGPISSSNPGPSDSQPNAMAICHFDSF